MQAGSRQITYAVDPKLEPEPPGQRIVLYNRYRTYRKRTGKYKPGKFDLEC